MGVKNNIRLALLFVCLMVVGIALYPYIPRLVKIAQAVQGELKFGATMDQEMRVINKTFYSNDLYFGNAAGGTIGVMQGNGNLGVGMGTSTANMRTPQQRLSVADTMAITNTAGIQYLLMGNQDSGGAGNPAIIRAANGSLEIGKGSAWIGPGGTFTSNVFFANGGNVGIGSTAPTKKLDVVGDINFSGTLYQAGSPFTGSKWTNTTGGIYYNTGNVGIGTTAPGGTLDINGSLIYSGGNTDIRLFGLNRSIGIASGDFVNIGSFSNNGTSNYTKFHISSHNGCVIQDDEFEVRQLAYLGTSTSWLELPVTHVSANHDGVQKYAIDVRVINQSSTSQAMEARLRVKNAICGAGNISVDIETNASFTADSTAGTGATIAGYWGSRNWDFPVTSGNSWNNATAGLFVANGGNVGIGTSAPAKKLDIVAANSTINNTSGNLSIVPNANLLITQGNVGMGTTNPTLGRLQVEVPDAGFSGVNSTGRPFWAISGGVNSYKSLRFTNNTSPTSTYLWDFNTIPGNDATNPDGFGIWGTSVGQMMTFKAAGNVGISSTNPGAKLDVGGTTSTIANVSGNLSIVPASNLIVTQGNVGIGSTSPGYKLDVNGALSVTGATRIVYGSTPTAISSLLVRNTSAADTGGYSAALKFSVEGGGDWAKGGVIFERTGAYGIGKLHLATRNATDTSDLLLTDAKLTVDSAGNVGIGSTAPRASLDLSSKTDGIIPPQGTTAQRPGSPVTGTMRYNTTLGRPEYYNGTAWIAIVSPSGPVLATGGEITEVGGYRIHTFRTSGTFTVASNITADVLVVAGGGGGGAYSTTNANGGGGGGGVVYAVNQALTPAAYTVTIGRGGTGYTWNTNSCGTNGANSVFGALPAAIGGGGGAGQSSCAGGAGGSGGGCSQNTAAGASNQTGAGTNITVYGNAGGSGSYTWTGCGGGGAGSAGVGGNAAANTYPSGNGGNGITLTISGSSVCYAGGGGGGGNSSERAGKGFCGGGRGFGSTNYGDATGDDYRNYPDSLDPVTGGSRDVHGISNTGGGGGGGSYWSPNVGHYHAGSGGSGIVIVRYAIP